NPLYRKYGYFGQVELSGVDAIRRGTTVAVPAAPPNTVQIVQDASGTRSHLPESLRSAGVRIEPLSEIWGGDARAGPDFLGELATPTDRLGALSLALLNRGYRLHVPSRLGRTVHVQEFSILSEPHQALSVRRSIVVGAGTELLHTEEVHSRGPVEHQRLYASSTSIEAEADSRVASLVVHAPDRRTVSIYDRRAVLGDRTRLGWVYAGFGGFRTKVRNRSTLTGNGANFEDMQTFYGDTDQQYDTAMRVEHVGTDTHSQSITRGVFKDRARGMSRGLVRIEPPARRTLSYLSEHAMLLSPHARSDTNPDLEILCRDVKATHSSSVAPVDPEKVFYLESRGMKEGDAVRMIGEGFLSFVLDRSPIGNLRDLLYPHLASRWDGGDLFWSEGEYPTLPPLAFSGTDPGTDWRFDSKLR
ncbi:MAG: SufD family Fe-S cluster assembly protein, partial [Thermoplasmata archaeon]|nr:SufD family Fe-S cluster assembly protein [Thermoplasmata archaeon]